MFISIIVLQNQTDAIEIRESIKPLVKSMLIPRFPSFRAPLENSKSGLIIMWPFVTGILYNIIQSLFYESIRPCKRGGLLRGRPHACK